MKRVNPILVAGLGNDLRGDDAAGLLAVRALRAIDVDGADVEEHGGDVAALAESMARHPKVIVVDAIDAPVAPGTVMKLSGEDPLRSASTSSHGFGLREAIALARVLGGDPKVEVYAIAGDGHEFGTAPSAAVVRAAAEVAVDIEERITCA